jgi:PPOX class probable F420-dependent enzyme
MPAGYGIKREDAGMLALDRLDEKLAASRNYWIVSTRPDGRPHAMPVWGIWLEGSVMFSTDPTSRKGRNLSARPDVVVHLESGDDVVIVEGRAETVTDAALRTRFADAYEAKYQFRPDPGNPDHGVYQVRPVRAFSWLEKDFPVTATRWDWER